MNEKSKGVTEEIDGIVKSICERMQSENLTTRERYRMSFALAGLTELMSQLQAL